MTQDTQGKIVTAALAIIGDEILSGRTQDTNTQWIAGQLKSRGIALREVRVVPDDAAIIIRTVNELRAQADYLFTTGGLGATHDDITAESIAAAFNVALEQNDAAMDMLRAYYKRVDKPLNETRARMARIPAGAVLIPNPVSGAPGFAIGNVYVLAGVPSIMQAMFMHIEGSLRRGAEIYTESVESPFPEGEIARPLADLQKQYPDVNIGSYPKMEADGRWRATIVFTARDQAQLQAARQGFEGVLQSLQQTPNPPILSNNV